MQAPPHGLENPPASPLCRGDICRGFSFPTRTTLRVKYRNFSLRIMIHLDVAGATQKDIWITDGYQKPLPWVDAMVTHHVVEPFDIGHLHAGWLAWKKCSLMKNMEGSWHSPGSKGEWLSNKCNPRVVSGNWSKIMMIERAWVTDTDRKALLPDSWEQAVALLTR